MPRNLAPILRVPASMQGGPARVATGKRASGRKPQAGRRRGRKTSGRAGECKAKVTAAAAAVTAYARFLRAGRQAGRHARQTYYARG